VAGGGGIGAGLGEQAQLILVGGLPLAVLGEQRERERDRWEKARLGGPPRSRRYSLTACSEFRAASAIRALRSGDRATSFIAGV